MTAALGQGSPLRPGDRLPTGRRADRVVAVLALLAALLALVAWLLSHDGPGLADRRLQGPRGPACVRMVVGVDQSGSMRDYADARDRAFAQLLPWLGQNLRTDDTVAVVDFAQDAGLRIVAGAGRLDPALGRRPAPVHEGRYTRLEPVLERLDALGPSPCDTALVLLSDGQVTDIPADADGGRALLRAHGVHDLLLLTPDTAVTVPPAWDTAFPSPPVRHFDGADPDATAEAFGEATGFLTHQTLATD